MVRSNLVLGAQNGRCACIDNVLERTKGTMVQLPCFCVHHYKPGTIA